MKTFIYMIIPIILFSGCTSSESNQTVSTSTILDSDDFENKKDRIEILKREIVSYSDFSDAEFELFNVNGFNNQRNSVPGPSSWDYKFVIKIDTADISKWTEGMKQVNLKKYEDNWTREITKQRNLNWVTQSKPSYFIRNDEEVTMLVYKIEGIIYKRVTNE